MTAKREGKQVDTLPIQMYGETSEGAVKKIAINSNGELILSDISGGTSQGQMMFWDATLGKWTYAETSELFWDDTNKRLGIGTVNPNSTLQNAGSLSLPYVEKTAIYTLTASDYTVNCTANTFTITLPTAVGITGRIYNIKNSGTGIITVDASGSETIDGELTQTLYETDSICLQSTGSNWIII